MTTALAFERAGADVTLFEQAERLSVVGAGIQLGPNAVHVLDALGLGDDLRKVASFPEAVFLRDAVHGRELARIPFGQAAQDRFGAPFLQLHRAELSQLLFEAVNARGIDTRFGAVARATPEAQVAAGKYSGQFELVVLADGIRSQGRLDLLGGGKPQFSGFVAYRASVDVNPPDPGGTNWIGPAQHMVVYPMLQEDKPRTNIVAITKAERPPGQGWSNTVSPDEFRSQFAGFPPAAQALMDTILTARAWGLFAHDPMPRWSRGRVVALGDAAHAMVPFLAQGAGMGIEDAWALTHALNENTSLPQSFAAYEAARQPRVNRVAAASRQSGRIYHLGGPMRLARNMTMPLMKDRLARRFDWIYGYDPVAEMPLF